MRRAVQCANYHKKCSLIFMLTLRMKQITGMDHETVTEKEKRIKKTKHTPEKKHLVECNKHSFFLLSIFRFMSKKNVKKSKRRGEKSC